MQLEYVIVGSVPYDEPCAQVGKPDYRARMRLETDLYIRMLEAEYPPPPGCRFCVKAFPHDFGTYHEVVAEYTPEHAQWAYMAENGLAVWDETSIAALKAGGYEVAAG